MNDFCLDHASCSRVHAAFVYHSHLQRAFLVDLGSTHGTFIGSLRLEANKPTQLPPNASFHFGASTRDYVMRERPQGNTRNVIDQLERGEATSQGAAMLGLTETTAELDNLTEFNTAHNRRISMLGIGEEVDSASTSRSKKKRRSVTFNEDQEVINPEDVDPTVGRFRNMVHTTVIPGKRQRLDGIGVTSGLTSDDKQMGSGLHLHPKHLQSPSGAGTSLYGDLLPHSHTHLDAERGNNPILSSVLASRLGISLPDPAPDIDLAPSRKEESEEPPLPQIPVPPPAPNPSSTSATPSKKIYAKEAWPGSPVRG